MSRYKIIIVNEEFLRLKKLALKNHERALEYFDNIWFCFENIVSEIQQTREDTLKSFEQYASAIPDPLVTPDSRSNR